MKPTDKATRAEREGIKRYTKQKSHKRLDNQNASTQKEPDVRLNRKTHLKVPNFLEKLERKINHEKTILAQSKQPLTKLKVPKIELDEPAVLKKRYSDLVDGPYKVHSLDYYEAAINSLDQKKKNKLLQSSYTCPGESHTFSPKANLGTIKKRIAKREGSITREGSSVISHPVDSKTLEGRRQKKTQIQKQESKRHEVIQAAPTKPKLNNSEKLAISSQCNHLPKQGSSTKEQRKPPVPKQSRQNNSRIHKQDNIPHSEHLDPTAQPQPRSKSSQVSSQNRLLKSYSVMKDAGHRRLKKNDCSSDRSLIHSGSKRVSSTQGTRLHLKDRPEELSATAPAQPRRKSKPHGFSSSNAAVDQIEEFFKDRKDKL